MDCRRGIKKKLRRTSRASRQTLRRRGYFTILKCRERGKAVVSARRFALGFVRSDVCRQSRRILLRARRELAGLYALVRARV